MFMLSQKDHSTEILRKAKQRAKLKALRALRRTNPEPVMVSTLDLDQLSCSSEEEEKEEVEVSAGVKNTRQEQGEGQGDKSGPSTSSSSLSSQPPLIHCQQCPRLKFKVRLLKNKLCAFKNPPTSPLSSPPTTPLTTPPTTVLTPVRKKYERAKMDESALPRFGMYYVK